MAATLATAITIAWIVLSRNYHTVIPGELYRSGQMSERQLLAHATTDHLATIINLRPETNQAWHATEVSACASQGITHIDFPLDGNKAPTLARMVELVNTMKPARRPILIHCAHGADRTGLAVALYLSAISDQPEGEASRALSLRYGHLPVPRMRCFDRAFEAYCRSKR